MNPLVRRDRGPRLAFVQGCNQGVFWRRATSASKYNIFKCFTLFLNVDIDQINTRQYINFVFNYIINWHLLIMYWNIRRRSGSFLAVARCHAASWTSLLRSNFFCLEFIIVVALVCLYWLLDIFTCYSMSKKEHKKIKILTISGAAARCQQQRTPRVGVGS